MRLLDTLFGPRLVRGGAITILLLGFGAAVAWGLVRAHDAAGTEDEEDAPIKAPLRVSTVNGELVVTLAAAAQAQNAIKTVTPEPSTYRDQVRAYGMVLDLQQLTDLANSYANATAQTRTVEAKLAASQSAYQRAQKLYQQQQVISAADLETSEAAFRSDQAALAAAQSQVRTLAATAVQDWGPVLGQSLVAQAPLVTRLIQRQDFLVQVTLPPGVSIAAAPKSAEALLDSGARVTLSYVSPATKTDPRIQGLSYFYVGPADKGLLPGLNLVALLSNGGGQAGERVPESAVVWLQGKPWVYLRTGATTFSRRAISTDQPSPNGGYIVQGLPEGMPVVVQGAQALLSEEFRSQIEVGD